MPKAKKRVFKRKFFDGEPEGVVSLEGNLVRVLFDYSPQRLQKIKSIPGSRFHADSKSWTIPVNNIQLLESSPLFSRSRLTYSISSEVLGEDHEVRAEKALRARKCIAENPFSVPTELMPYISVDVIFELSSRVRGVLARPRFRSKAKRLIEGTAGAVWLRTDSAYFIPTASLSEILKKLRDNSLSFGVPETTSALLKESAKTRATLLKNLSVATSSELEAALLTPYIELVEYEDEPRVGFTLRSCTSSHLKILLSSITNPTERKKIAENFPESTYLEIVKRAREEGIPLYQSHKVHSFVASREKRHLDRIENAGDGFDESLLVVAAPKVCWIAPKGEKPALLIHPDYYDLHFKAHQDLLFKGAIKKPHVVFHESISLAVEESALPSFIDKLTSYTKENRLGQIPQSLQFKERLVEVERRAKLLSIRAQFQNQRDTSLDEIKFSDPELPQKLFPHQRVAVSWLLKTPRAFLGDDMGLGKTLSILVSFDALRETSRCDFLLVVCPNSLVRNWGREAARWTPTRRLVVIPPEKRDRIKTLKEIREGAPTDGLVINYEAVRLDYILSEVREIIDSRKTLLCLDESQRVKGATSKTFEALSQLAPLSSRRVLLSGTPSPKDITDLWAQYYLLDDGERFGKNFFEWLGTVAELGNEYSDFAIKKFKAPAVKETILRAHEIMLRRKKEDVVNLPSKTFTTRDIELTGDQKKRYDEIREGLILRVTSLQGAEFIREIDSVLEEYLRAVQVASNPRLIDEQWKGTPAKFAELDEIVRDVVELREEKIVIWTNFVKNVSEIKERYSLLGSAMFSGEVSTKERDKTVEEFQKGNSLKVLVAIPAAGGVGITLTAAQTAVYVDKTWNAEHWLQSIDRIHRIGQTGTVNIISLLGCGVDELISYNLRRKERAQAEVLGDTAKGATAQRPLLWTPPSYQQTQLEVPTREELIQALTE